MLHLREPGPDLLKSLKIAIKHHVEVNFMVDELVPAITKNTEYKESALIALQWLSNSANNKISHPIASEFFKTLYNKDIPQNQKVEIETTQTTNKKEAGKKSIEDRKAEEEAVKKEQNQLREKEKKAALIAREKKAAERNKSKREAKAAKQEAEKNKAIADQAAIEQARQDQAVKDQAAAERAAAKQAKQIEKEAALTAKKAAEAAQAEAERIAAKSKADEERKKLIAVKKEKRKKSKALERVNELIKVYTEEAKASYSPRLFANEPATTINKVAAKFARGYDILTNKENSLEDKKEFLNQIIGIQELEITQFKLDTLTKCEYQDNVSTQ